MLAYCSDLSAPLWTQYVVKAFARGIHPILILFPISPLLTSEIQWLTAATRTRTVKQGQSYFPFSFYRTLMIHLFLGSEHHRLCRFIFLNDFLGDDDGGIVCAVDYIKRTISPLLLYGMFHHRHLCGTWFSLLFAVHGDLGSYVVPRFVVSRSHANIDLLKTFCEMIKRLKLYTSHIILFFRQARSTLCIIRFRKIPNPNKLNFQLSSSNGIYK